MASVTSDPFWLCSQVPLGLKRGVWVAAGVCAGHVGEGTAHSETGGSQQEREFAESTETPACSYTGNSDRRPEPKCIFSKNK